MRKIDQAYHSKDGLFQVYNCTMAPGDVHKLEAAAPDEGSRIDGDDHYVKSPWTCILSSDSVFDATQHFGQDSDFLKQRKNQNTKMHAYSGIDKLFQKTPHRPQNGITQDVLENVIPNRTNSQNFDLNVQDGTIDYHYNMRMDDQEYNLKNLEWINQKHFVPNYMKKHRTTMPTSRTWLDHSHEVCITFMPPAVPGKGGFDRYDGYEEGVWMLWENDGDHTIRRRPDLYEKEWLIASCDLSLTGGATGYENEDHRFLRGMPYHLRSPEIVIKASTCMILHVKQLKV